MKIEEEQKPSQPLKFIPIKLKDMPNPELNKVFTVESKPFKPKPEPKPKEENKKLKKGKGKGA